MTTPTAPTAAGTILAIDLGRYKSAACAYGRVTATARFHTVESTRAEVARLLTRHPDAIVVVEAWANAGRVHDLAIDHGSAVRVAHTNGEAWKFKHLKRTTDRDDAQRLAGLEALGQRPSVAPPDPATRQRRALVAHRPALVGQRVAAPNRIRALFAAQGLPTPRGHRSWTELGLAGLDLRGKTLADCGPDELWRGLLHLAPAGYRHLLGQITAREAALDRPAAADPATRRLKTIPGVGPRTAEAVTAHLGDPRRFARAKQVGAFGGLVPRQYQSGARDRKGRITRRGPAVLRKLLVECAWAMLRYNPWARATDARLTRGGVTRKKPAIVALARKLLARCRAMVRDGTDGRPGPAPAASP
jgi:transposase